MTLSSSPARRSRRMSIRCGAGRRRAREKLNERRREAPPVIAHRKGFYYEVKAGKRYLWCSCGRSKTQPFCDGSHAGTGFLPVAFKAERDEDVIFCGCKHTGTGPFCDGTHSNLPGGYRDDDPDSAENRQVAARSPRAPSPSCSSTDSAMCSRPPARR